MAVDLLKKYEGTGRQEVIPDGEFPELLKFQPTKDYVREVLASQVTLTAENEEFADIDDIPSDYHFFAWNEHINGRTQDVPSHRVINGPSEGRRGLPVRGCRKRRARPARRKEDNTKLGRKQGIESGVPRKREREAVMA